MAKLVDPGAKHARPRVDGRDDGLVSCQGLLRRLPEAERRARVGEPAFVDAAEVAVQRLACRQRLPAARDDAEAVQAEREVVEVGAFGGRMRAVDLDSGGDRDSGQTAASAVSAADSEIVAERARCSWRRLDRAHEAEEIRAVDELVLGSRLPSDSGRCAGMPSARSRSLRSRARARAPPRREPREGRPARQPVRACPGCAPA